uniref:Secreted protein n=1 Tax=Cacopsylla melanoneura TaxID=428564 RepID=A0A8D8V366_9HEMI
MWMWMWSSYYACVGALCWMCFWWWCFSLPANLASDLTHVHTRYCTLCLNFEKNSTHKFNKTKLNEKKKKRGGGGGGGGRGGGGGGGGAGEKKKKKINEI